jgi:hypothetical protein
MSELPAATPTPTAVHSDTPVATHVAPAATAQQDSTATASEEPSEEPSEVASEAKSHKCWMLEISPPKPSARKGLTRLEIMQKKKQQQKHTKVK